MKVLFIASEVSPLAKVGGLADVAGSLPLALKERGVDIRIALPKYDLIDQKKYPSRLLFKNVEVDLGWRQEMINIYRTEIGSVHVPVFLIDHKRYLDRGGIYFQKTAICNSFAEIQRFLFFSASIFSLIRASNWYPNIIHCNDWHTAFVPALVRLKHMKGIKTLLTIHNLANQGQWRAKQIFKFLGLEGNEISSFKKLRKGPYGKDLNLMQQGILNADFINTVSPTYAKEILTKPYFASGLRQTLLRRKDNLVGILNGLDTERFNPQTDPYLKANYSFKNPELKKENKIYLEKRLSLKPDADVPLFGLVSRLTSQKGIDLVISGLKKIRSLNFRAVFLGRGEKKYERGLKNLAKMFPGKIATKIGFDVGLAQNIYAASDFFLIPSRFEPCGLTQLIALRYGTIPIVRKVGGLADTIRNIRIIRKEPGRAKEVRGNGFVLDEYRLDSFVKILKRAMGFYQNKNLWERLQRRVMQKDYSWRVSSAAYLELYKHLLKS